MSTDDNGSSTKVPSKAGGSVEDGETYIRADGKKVRRVRRAPARSASSPMNAKLADFLNTPSSADKPKIKSGSMSVSGDGRGGTTSDVYIREDGKKVRRVRKPASSSSSVSGDLASSTAGDGTKKSLSGFFDSKGSSKPRLGGSASVAGDQLAVTKDASLTGEVYIRADGKKVRRVKKASSGSSVSGASTTNADGQTVEIITKPDGTKVRRIRKVKAAGSSAASAGALGATATPDAAGSTMSSKLSGFLANTESKRPKGFSGSHSVAGDQLRASDKSKNNNTATTTTTQSEIYIRADGKKVRRVRKIKQPVASGAADTTSSNTAVGSSLSGFLDAGTASKPAMSGSATVSGDMNHTRSATTSQPQHEIFVRPDGTKVRRIRRTKTGEGVAAAGASAETPAAAATGAKSSLGGFLDKKAGPTKRLGGSASVAGDQLAVDKKSSLTGEVYIRADGKKVRRIKKKSPIANSQQSADNVEIITRPDGTKVRRIRRGKPKPAAEPEAETKKATPTASANGTGLLSFLDAQPKTIIKGGAATVSGERLAPAEKLESKKSVDDTATAKSGGLGASFDTKKSLAGFLDKFDGGSMPKKLGGSASVAGDQIAVNKSASLTGEVYIRADGKKVRRVKKPAQVSTAAPGDQVEIITRADGTKVRRIKRAKKPDAATSGGVLGSFLSTEGDKKPSFSGSATVGGGDDKSDIYIRADGKKVRRIRKPASAASVGDDRYEIVTREDGKKVRRLKKPVAATPADAAKDETPAVTPPKLEAVPEPVAAPTKEAEQAPSESAPTPTPETPDTKEESVPALKEETPIAVGKEDSPSSATEPPATSEGDNDTAPETPAASTIPEAKPEEPSADAAPASEIEPETSIDAPPAAPEPVVSQTAENGVTSATPEVKTEAATSAEEPEVKTEPTVPVQEPEVKTEAPASAEEPEIKAETAAPTEVPVAEESQKSEIAESPAPEQVPAVAITTDADIPSSTPTTVVPDAITEPVEVDTPLPPPVVAQQTAETIAAPQVVSVTADETKVTASGMPPVPEDQILQPGMHAVRSDQVLQPGMRAIPLDGITLEPGMVMVPADKLKMLEAGQMPEGMKLVGKDQETIPEGMVLVSKDQAERTIPEGMVAVPKEKVGDGVPDGFVLVPKDKIKGNVNDDLILVPRDRVKGDDDNPMAHIVLMMPDDDDDAAANDAKNGDEKPTEDVDISKANVVSMDELPERMEQLRKEEGGNGSAPRFLLQPLPSDANLRDNFIKKNLLPKEAPAAAAAPAPPAKPPKPAEPSADIAQLLAKMSTMDNFDGEKMGELLQRLQDAEKRQKQLEKQLQQAGVAIAEEIDYDVCMQKVQEIGKRMNEIGGSDVTHPDKAEQNRLREEYFKLEQGMEKYNSALMLTDEYQAEQDRAEKKWEEDNEPGNIEALMKLRRHMPVEVRNMSEAMLTNEPSPNGKYLPKGTAKKFKRTNVLQLIRRDPDDITRMHPSTLENMRVTGLTLTERRGLYEHLRPAGPKWKAQKAEKMTERKWTWYNMMKGNFKENLASWQRHVDQYGPPGSHPYATRANPNEGCPLIGKQCPLKADKLIDYDGDYGWTDKPEFEVSEVKKSDVDDPGAKAMAEAKELMREKKANERGEALKKHYKGKLLQVAKANGSCESMDEAMDKMEYGMLKWIEDIVNLGDDKSKLTEDVKKKEIANFTDVLGSIKLLILDFCERSGMQLSGKQKAGGGNPDIRSAVECNLTMDVIEQFEIFTKFVNSRMKELDLVDTRVKSTVGMLDGLLKNLKTINESTLKNLGVERAERSRKLKTQEEIETDIKAKQKEAAPPPDEEESGGGGGGGGPPLPGPPRGGLMDALKGGRGGGGGRGGLMDALKGGRGGGGGRGGLMDALKGGRGGGGGGRGGLMDALKGGRGGGGRGGLMDALKAGRGGGGGGGGRGGLMDALKAGRGGRGGGGGGGGRGGLLDAIKGGGAKGGGGGGGGRGGLLDAIKGGRGGGGDGPPAGGRGGLMAAIQARSGGE